MIKGWNKVVLTMVIGLASMVVHANQKTVVNFDELSGGYNVNAREYQGVFWRNFRTPEDWRLYEWETNGGYALAASSGERAIVLGPYSEGLIAAIEGQILDFHSAQMTAIWNDDLEVTVKGYFNGELIKEEIILLSSTENKLIEFEGFTGLDRITFRAEGGTKNPAPNYNGFGTGGYHFAMDDVTFTTMPAVPEPSTYLLMLSGLGLMGLMVKRRSKVF